MSSSIELLSLNELNIRRENLIQLVKKVDEEIEKRKEKNLEKHESLMIPEIPFQDQIFTEKVEKKKIKINITIKK